MKRTLLFSLFFLIFHCSDAQKLEIKYYPGWGQLFGKYLILNDDDTCTIKLEVFNPKDCSKIRWTDTIIIPNEYMDEIRKIFQTIYSLPSTKPACFDGGMINGVFENDTSHYLFEYNCPFTGEQYDFLEELAKFMLKAFEKRKSKRFAKFASRCIR